MTSAAKAANSPELNGMAEAMPLQNRKELK